MLRRAAVKLAAANMRRLTPELTAEPELVDVKLLDVVLDVGLDIVLDAVLDMELDVVLDVDIALDVVPDMELDMELDVVLGVLLLDVVEVEKVVELVGDEEVV